MANDESCKVRGISIVKLKMHGVIRILIGIRHIPYMRKNLISLSTRAMGGHIFIGDGDFVEVMKGAFTVIKDQLIGRLYIIQASVVTSTAVVSSSISNSDIL